MAISAAVPERTWLGQPRGVVILFLTETWENFSLYGMRAILVFYMTKQLLFSQGYASLVYGAYTAFIYLTPIVGGAISDRFLTRRAAILLGGGIMAAGHFMLISEALFFPGLALIAIGNGFFLPSLPSQILTLFRPGDPRINSAYNIYYAGVNLGAFIAPLICGTLGEIYGWHWGFAAAGIGMLLGLTVYVAGGRYLPREDRKPVKSAKIADRSPTLTPSRSKIILLGSILLVVVLFRGAYEQVGNTVPLWIDARVDREISAGHLIPMTWFQSFNPLFVLTLTPFLVAWQNQRLNQSTSPLIRMSLGASIVAGAYLILSMADQWFLSTGVLTPWWVVALFMLLLTAGELLVLPTGLGLFGRAAPHIAATMIAIWYLAKFGGNFFAGVVGTLMGPLGAPGFFLLLAALALGASLALGMLHRLFKEP